ncbi:MAG: arylesterase [Burkholderiales bacterium]|nr:arylesterase [Pseudomonadota bacterium]MCC7069433.1 arylesterase [Burkholderiales bacterium]
MRRRRFPLGRWQAFALLLVWVFAWHATPGWAASRILVVGDSLSAGYGLTQGEGWVDLLTQKLGRERPGTTVINASISGDTTAGGLARLPALLEKHRPDIVIIELGGNDGLRGAPVATTRANLRRMIELAKAAPARVLLLGMRMPPNFGPTYTAQFEAMYAELARAQGAALVPFFLERIATDLGKFQPDRIHPTAAAQPELVATVWPALMKLLR